MSLDKREEKHCVVTKRSGVLFFHGLIVVVNTYSNGLYEIFFQ